MGAAKNARIAAQGVVFMYIHELNEWPNFCWDPARLQPLLAAVRQLQFELCTELSELGFDDQVQASVRILTEEVVKTSEIEGQKLDPEDVRSSIARKLGLDTGGLRKAERLDRNVDGIVNVVLDATRNYSAPLTENRLHGWHAALFPTGWTEFQKIGVGQWRDQPVQVISSPFSKQTVHFEAPASLRLPEEMEKFLAWFERDDVDPILKVGIAHLYFVTIHPFEDGNGRIARAIADLAMSRADKMEQRFYSMSAQIRNDRKDYYNALESAQKGTLDITDWLDWFLSCLIRSIDWARQALHEVLRKARVWRSLKDVQLNERQHKIMNKLLDGDFFGNLNAPKYAKMTDCSPDTANRDLAHLVECGVLEKSGKGKSTKYTLKDLL